MQEQVQNHQNSKAASKAAPAIDISSRKELQPQFSEAITEVLNELLANEFGLFTKTLNYHWNITGPRFFALHQFLEQHYKDLLVVMDDVAERVRILGGRPVSTVREMESVMSVGEDPGVFPTADQMLADLLETHMEIQKEIKKSLTTVSDFEDDVGTEDFMIGLLKQHEKTAWMLRAHLEER